jgi:hypothetical protein
MRMVSCGRAEKLVPLYAAGDLPSNRRGRAVAAHVAACAACAALAEEFRASREWARAAGAVPEFGEEFYEGLRASVLDEISRDTRPAAPSRLTLPPAAFAGRRLAFAASLAAAACALAFAFYFLSGPRRPQREDIAAAPPGGELVGPPQRVRNAPAPHDVPAQEEHRRRRQPSPRAAPRDERPARPTERRGGGSYKRTPTLLRRPSDPAREPELTASADDARQTVAPSARRAETASVSRIEIQTADPNIRIIWLAPAAGADDGPGAADPDRVDPER